MRILGLDLGKFKSVGCLFDPETNAVVYHTVPTSPETFREFLRRVRPEKVVFETCTIAGWVADLCEELQVPYVVANTLHEAWQWRKVKRKTDRDDALKLARMESLGQLPAVSIPPKRTREFRSLVKYRHRLMERRISIQNHIRAVCQRVGHLLPAAHRAWTAAGLELLRSLAKPLSECTAEEFWKGELDQEVRSLEEVVTHLVDVETKLESLARQDSRTQLLQSIPGVGRVTAEVIVAFVDDPRRFHSAREVSAYAGLVPRQFQSGELDRHGRITKRGFPLLRRSLVEVSWLLLRYNPWALRLMARISRGQKMRRKQALVAIARKLLVRCWAMLRDGTRWHDPVITPLTASG